MHLESSFSDVVIPIRFLRTHYSELDIDIEGKLLGIKFDLLLVLLFILLIIRRFIYYALPLTGCSIDSRLDFLKFQVNLQVWVIGEVTLHQILFSSGLDLVAIY